MNIDGFNSFTAAINYAERMFLLHAQTPVHTDTWQGIDISKKPEMAMHELLNFSFLVPIEDDRTMGDSILDHLRRTISPNLPWADNHFNERITGQPYNPGNTWQAWPFAKSASTFLDKRGQFNHNYMERYWPKYANMTPDGYLKDTQSIVPHSGIRFKYGDLNDVIDLLAHDPLTRQAYLPVWFPEDTGQPENGRKPCTLGYHFIMRERKLHIVYYIRSCDFVRHFRDDIYLTVRLLVHVLESLQVEDPNWNNVIPGDFVMHITSLHMFRNDYNLLKGK